MIKNYAASPTTAPHGGPIRRAWTRFWGWVDVSRRFTINLIFLGIVLAILFAILVPSGGTKFQNKTALVLNLAGPLLDEDVGSPRDRALNAAQGIEPASVRVRDVITVLDAASRDDKITQIMMILDSFEGGGMANLREFAAAMERYKATGKKITVWGSNFDQRSLYLAAHANELWMHPMGMTLVQGFGRTRNYYKDAFDKLGIRANVVRMGQFKNALETFSARGPSKETQESDAYLYDALWAQYLTDVEKARKLSAGAVMATINDLPNKLRASGGDAAKLALSEKWVDALKTRDEMRDEMIKRGEKDGITFRQVSFGDYLGSLPKVPPKEAVGIVVAQGEIIDGPAPSGTVGGMSTSDIIRRARGDDSIKAIVLRVNSPGGSPYGSELVRRELELTRAAGKPVVISMGNVAASGGYWISMAADEIMADPATITGSIGVVGALPTGTALFATLGIGTGGHHTTWLGKGYDFRTGIDPRFEDLVKQSIGQIYADFTTRAAQARKTTPDKIDAVGQGRVWTGAQAKDRGLVDTLGGLQDAVASAAKRAKLEVEAGKLVPVKYLEKESGKWEKWIELLTTRVVAALAPAIKDWMGADLSARLLSGLLGTSPALARDSATLEWKGVSKDLGWLAQLPERAQRGQPFVATVHCLCAAP